MSYSYLFDDFDTAVSAEMYICEVGRVPIDGFNGGTYVPNLDYKKFTDKWADVKQTIDGKFGFSVVPTEITDNYPLSAHDYFVNTFNPSFGEIPMCGWVNYRGAFI